ncbi:imidazole glycerol phosphate synthase subunit HisH [Qipengyuania atrilutea]|uniref:Imidazole glycerol phosphate synthase subunit HisH n=1 Tax=Qipengyuania atrilutea TaxID=2744473 RepID=A0A850H1E7_9SPHN|nr:imidazole glycerol phosphate synthase subunit HisH [Actirhodobacter atriluteus]NVD45794.1 imidazole glycerol phosphate synthase subunit HisH [Actirhodobacter atriluteus]
MGNSVALIDYGAGNLHSVENALRKVGAEVNVTADSDVVARAERIILPGVGSFKSCAEGLRAVDGMVEAMESRALSGGVPFLGICVGMQLLATRGLEHDTTDGLDWISGDVELIEPDDPKVKVPHMGWNDVGLTPHAHGNEVVQPGEAYFLHSYRFHAEDGADIVAMTDHGGGIVAAVGRDNLLGVQFHPEKSQAYGLDLLSRFLEWNP